MKRLLPTAPALAALTLIALSPAHAGTVAADFVGANLSLQYRYSETGEVIKSTPAQAISGVMGAGAQTPGVRLPSSGEVNFVLSGNVLGLKAAGNYGFVGFADIPFAGIVLSDLTDSLAPITGVQLLQPFSPSALRFDANKISLNLADRTFKNGYHELFKVSFANLEAPAIPPIAIAPNAVPEPASFALVLSGLGLATWAGRRSRRQRASTPLSA